MYPTYPPTRDRVAVDAVLHVLRDNGVQAVVAGGAARDLYWGRIPKDYDLIIIGEAPSVDDLADDLRDQLAANVTPFGNGSSMADVDSIGGGSDRLDYVIKVEFNGVHIDVLKHVDDYPSPLDAVRNFDFSLNFIWLNDKWEAVPAAEFPILVDGTVIMGDNPSIDDPHGRVQYLRSKYPQYVYPTYEEIEVKKYLNAKGT